LEDQSLLPTESTNIKTGSLHQFVQNSESKKAKKVLRVIHAPSDLMQQFPFTTDYLAWRETRSLPYCKEEEYSSIGALRWNDYDNADALQKWTLIPHGLGLYMQIRAGSKWIIVASPAALPFNVDLFGNTDLFLPDFLETGTLNDLFVHPEAILLTEGMGM
jgi:hypothetical protein